MNLSEIASAIRDAKVGREKFLKRRRALVVESGTFASSFLKFADFARDAACISGELSDLVGESVSAQELDFVNAQMDRISELCHQSMSEVVSRKFMAGHENLHTPPPADPPPPPPFDPPPPPANHHPSPPADPPPHPPPPADHPPSPQADPPPSPPPQQESERKRKRPRLSISSPPLTPEDPQSPFPIVSSSTSYPSGAAMSKWLDTYKSNFHGVRLYNLTSFAELSESYDDDVLALSCNNSRNFDMTSYDHPGNRSEKPSKFHHVSDGERLFAYLHKQDLTETICVLVIGDLRLLRRRLDGHNHMLLLRYNTNTEKYQVLQRFKSVNIARDDLAFQRQFGWWRLCVESSRWEPWPVF